MNAAASSPPPAVEVVRLDSCRPLDDETLSLARALVARLGLTEAARATGIAKNTLGGAAAGARLREGTRMSVADRLHRYVASER